MEFFFHVWKKNSMHGKKFPCMEMLDEGLQCKQILKDDLVVMSVKISLMFSQWPKIGPFV